MAGKYALAAGKIYIFWKNPVSAAIEEPVILSGFWLNGYFITVAHFFTEMTYDEKTENDIIKAMISDNVCSWVSMRVNSEKVVG